MHFFLSLTIVFSSLSSFPPTSALTLILSYAQYRSETHVQWQNAQVGFPAFEIKSKGDVLSHVLGVLMTILNFSDFLGRICRTQHIAIPIDKIYYGEKIQSRINKGKGTGAVSGGN